MNTRNEQRLLRLALHYLTLPLLIACISSISHNAFANSQVDVFISKQMKEQNIPGLGILVMQNGKTIKNQGFGFSNLELRTPVTPDSVFQLASASKHFTAFAILTLVDKGKISSLDDTVNKYLSGKVPDNLKIITIRQLLSHTSGLPGLPAELDMQKNYNEDELLTFIGKQKLLFPPGKNWMYSNSGYVLLGIIIHKITGQFYGDYLQEVIFKPLGMNSTRINDIREIIPRRAAGYEMIDNVLKNQSWISPTLNSTADGSVLTTLNDMAKWNEALDKQKILSKEMYNAWWTPIQLKDGTSFPYGLGWIIGSINHHKHIEHAGQWQGFRSQISRFPDDKFTVVVLMNSNHVDPVFIAQEVTGIYKPNLSPPHEKSVQVLQSTLDRYVGTYKQALLNIEIKIEATKNNELIMSSGTNKIRFLPFNETSFYTPNGAMTLTFSVDTQQHVVSLTQHIQGDIQLAFQRINP
jgi:D-alanyl-D-alanine carboxypeptidase